MQLPLEAVPNFSEGRNRATIDALAAALSRHADLLDVHADDDHNRSVFTLAGDEDALASSLLAGVAVARDRIDLARHEGAHPRIGAADVVPIVPLRAEHFDRARAVALVVAERIARELDLPVFLYGALADGRGPAFFRRGGLDALSRRLADGELVPDFGPRRLHPSAGAVLVGARRPLIAFNVNLGNADVALARDIAALVRETGGGFSGVRALGLELPRAGLVQVSMNVEDHEAAELHDIVARIRREAEARGARVVGAELVGLMPAAVAVAAARSALGVDALDSSRILEVRLLERARRPGAPEPGATLGA